MFLLCRDLKEAQAEPHLRHPEIVRLLLERGADVGVREETDNDGIGTGRVSWPTRSRLAAPAISIMKVAPLYARGLVVEAVWEWRFNFEIHWGAHLTAAQRAIHVYFSNEA